MHATYEGFAIMYIYDATGKIVEHAHGPVTSNNAAKLHKDLCRITEQEGIFRQEHGENIHHIRATTYKRFPRKHYQTSNKCLGDARWEHIKGGI